MSMPGEYASVYKKEGLDLPTRKRRSVTNGSVGYSKKTRGAGAASFTARRSQ